MSAEPIGQKHSDSEALLREVEAAYAEAQIANRRLEFLAQTSTLLSQSLDRQATLDTIARLAVPELCDWMTLDLLETAAEDLPFLRLAVVAHVDPAEVEALRDLRRRYPITMTQMGQPPVAAIQTGESVFLPEITPEMVTAASLNEEQRRHIERLDLLSLVSVPLRTAQGQILGALTLAACRSTPRVAFTQETVRLTEELAARAAAALENARLYAETQAKSREVISILESVSDAFFGLDADWRFTYVNREAERVLLRKRGELVGKNLWEEFPAAIGTEFETQDRSRLLSDPHLLPPCLSADRRKRYNRRPGTKPRNPRTLLAPYKHPDLILIPKKGFQTGIKAKTGRPKATRLRLRTDFGTSLHQQLLV